MSEPSRVPLGATPTEPSTAYLHQLDEEREAALRTQSHPGSDHVGAPAALRTRLEEQVAEHFSSLDDAEAPAAEEEAPDGERGSLSERLRARARRRGPERGRSR